MHSLYSSALYLIHIRAPSSAIFLYSAILSFGTTNTNPSTYFAMFLHLPRMLSLISQYRISSSARMPALPDRSAHGCRLLYLYQVATGVVEEGYDHTLHYFCWLHCELHTELLQSFMLCANIRNTETCRGNTLLKNCFLVCFCCRIIVRFKYKLGAVLIVRRDNGEPPVLPAGMSLFFTKPRVSV